MQTSQKHFDNVPLLITFYVEKAQISQQKILLITDIVNSL